MNTCYSQVVLNKLIKKIILSPIKVRTQKWEQLDKFSEAIWLVSGWREMQLQTPDLRASTSSSVLYENCWDICKTQNKPSSTPVIVHKGYHVFTTWADRVKQKNHHLMMVTVKFSRRNNFFLNEIFYITLRNKNATLLKPDNNFM